MTWRFCWFSVVSALSCLLVFSFCGSGERIESEQSKLVCNPESKRWYWQKTRGHKGFWRDATTTEWVVIKTAIVLSIPLRQNKDMADKKLWGRVLSRTCGGSSSGNLMIGLLLSMLRRNARASVSLSVRLSVYLSVCLSVCQQKQLCCVSTGFEFVVFVCMSFLHTHTQIDPPKMLCSNFRTKSLYHELTKVCIFVFFSFLSFHVYKMQLWQV